MIKHSEDFREYGIGKAWIFNIPYVVIFKADYVERILSSSKLITKGREYKYLKPWLGDGLLLSTGEKWRKRRKLLTPSFHFQVLKDFMQVFNEHSITLLSKFQKYADHEREVDIFKDLSLCTLDIICETAMGCHVNAQMGNNADYVNAVNEACRCVHIRQKNPMFYPDWIFNKTPWGKIVNKSVKILHSFTKSVIEKRREELINLFGECFSKKLIPGKNNLLKMAPKNTIYV